MYRYFFKRLIGFLGALMAIIILSPLFIVVSIWLHFANKGAGVFFFQTRIGRNEKPFKILKFKSMTDECGEDGKLLSDNQRLTKAGRFVRSTSIDELPQLINILKGDMAFIGPRPLPGSYLPYYTEREAHRHDVRPGISGWAQIHGRTNIDWDQRLACDAYYVENLTLWLDIKIFFLTIFKVMKRENVGVDKSGLVSLYDVREVQRPRMSNDFAEIGSEFWIESVPRTLQTERDGVYALSGRTAIDLILQDILTKRLVRDVYMPAWCCDSMLAPFLDRNVEVKFYDIVYTGKLEYRIDRSVRPDIFYLTNYFGYENTLPPDFVRMMKEQGSVILYDRTHSFLMDDEPYRQMADYSFASLRKWMGIVGGAVVEGIPKPELKPCNYIEIKEVAMQDKFRYLQGDKTIVKQNFLDAFGAFDGHLAADYRNREMDDLSYTLYKQQDLQAIKQKRLENAAFIHRHLYGLRFLFELTDLSAPLFVPVLFDSKEQRDAVRRKLIAKQIYCPVHWPKLAEIPACYDVQQITDRGLSLLCDQRYGHLQMKYQIESIQQFI
ncbi:MAG: sugar transferase [Candidatus Cryptobacteroides sp.]|jgi:undecaprenyl phosphate N,N'-diacetylbacillosamine 1-phosphate transferase